MRRLATILSTIDQRKSILHNSDNGIFMKQTENVERREYFRIEMTAMVSVLHANDQWVDASDYFPELHSMALLGESGNIDNEINALSERIKDITVKKTIDLLRQKISIVSKLVNINIAQNSQLVSQAVDISEKGCSVHLDQHYTVGQRLAVALIFTPSYFSLFSFATISECSMVGQQYKYLLTFEKLTEPQKQELIKQMFKAQTSNSQS